MQIRYSSPSFFYPKQQEIFDCESRFTVVISANKTGKTLLCACWLNKRALLGDKGNRYVWLAPYSKTATIGFEKIKEIIMGTPIYKHLKEINHPNQFKFNASPPQKITYPNGNIVDFVQGQNIDALFGEEYNDAVVDEGTRLKQKIVEVDGKQEIICPAFDALETNLRITQGHIKLISNPTIKNNWLYIWYQKILKGEDERASAFHLSALDAVEAGFLPQSEFDYAQKHKSSYAFKKDWLGEVPEQENSVFRADKVYECVDDEIHQNLAKVYYMGVDVGFTVNNKSDYTVVAGMNKKGENVYFKRFKAEGQELINKLKSYINNRPCYIDATAGGGHTIFSLLQKDCPQLEPFKFNNKNKCSTIETLAHYIHTNKITYPNNDIIINELLGYESETDAKGTTVYSNGKSVQHDDSVIALALATLKYKESEDNGEEPTFNIYSIGEDDDVDWDGKNKGNWTDMDEYEFNYNL